MEINSAVKLQEETEGCIGEPEGPNTNPLKNRSFRMSLKTQLAHFFKKKNLNFSV